MVYDIVKRFPKENRDINFVLTPNEIQKFLTAFLSTEKFTPISINWETDACGGYCREYYLTLTHFENNGLFISSVYRDGKFIKADNNDIILISAGININTYDVFRDNYDNVYLFDIED